MHLFRDILVTPFTQLLHRGGPGLHRGGPHWPGFERQPPWIRNCRRGAPNDEPPDPALPEVEMEERLAWGGPLVRHFGHQIAEFGMRLAPTLAQWPEAVFLHAGHREAGVHTLADTPDYFRAMLDWIGLPEARVRIIDRPTLVRELVVAPQAEQIGGPGPSEAHLDWLDARCASRLQKVKQAGTVYVSRAGVRARFAGESYLEQLLGAAGVTVVRPETIPLQEQLRTYASADRLIFAEGSAVHGTQLLGRALGHVLVLRRRSQSTMGRTALAPRAKSLQYLDAVLGVVHGRNRYGTPELWTGISVLDSQRLLAELEGQHIQLRDLWRQDAFEEARDADIRWWLQGCDRRPDGCAELLRETLCTVGLPQLAGEV